MEFGRAFSYVFADPDWLKKVGIAALVILIPLIGPIIVMGWGLEITRRVINLDPQPLPDWDDFGGFVSKGFQAFVVSLAYALPIILIVICGQVITAGSAAALSDSNSDAVGGIVTVVSLCLMCLAIVLGIATSLIMPAAIGNLAATGQLGSAFRFNDVFGLVRAALGPYLLSILCVFGAVIVLSPLGSLVCGIGALATSAYITALSSHLYGQAYNVAKSVKAAAPAM
jgi:hypothetical protein